MSKERLEEIEKKVSKQVYDRLIVPKTKVAMDYQDYRYLYEQAERVQELEEELDAQIESNRKLDKINRKWLRKNEHYREALKNIRSVQYDDDFNPYAYMKLEIFEWAEEALEGEE